MHTPGSHDSQFIHTLWSLSQTSSQSLKNRLIVNLASQLLLIQILNFLFTLNFFVIHTPGTKFQILIFESFQNHENDS